jgi:hypothetical protein
LPCVIGLTCADDICRAPCTPGVANGTTGGCLATQTCALISGQNVCIDRAGDGGAGSGDGGSDAGGDGSKGVGNPDANPCVSAQTAFGNTAQGDSNPSFQSGVGVRTANDLYIFSGYVGPGSSGDAGDAGGAINAVYVQAFDSQTAHSKASAQRLFTQPDLITSTDTVGTNMVLYSSAVAPTGQIALVYVATFTTAGSGLYAAFLDSAGDAGGASDGGAAGLQVQNVVLLATDQTGQGQNSQPHVIWSDASDEFVVSWTYNSGEESINVSKFLVGGVPAGGGTSRVPTNDPSGDVDGTFGSGPESGSVGESGDLFGVAYSNVSNSYPEFTLLDSVGNQVGTSIELATTGVGNWVSVAGTSKGFIYFYDQASTASVAEVFLAPSGDAGVVGGFSDGGDAGALPTFSFAGERANAARAISDGTGGAGGVGLALLYPSGVSFAYVNADGVGHQGPISVFAHTYGAGDEVSMTNFAGSFVVSLYNASANLTQVAASGCQ